MVGPQASTAEAFLDSSADAVLPGSGIEPTPLAARAISRLISRPSKRVCHAHCSSPPWIFHT